MQLIAVNRWDLGVRRSASDRWCGWSIALCGRVAVRVSLSGWSGFGGSSSFGPSGSCLLLSLPSPSLAFPLHRVEYRSKPMPHSTRKPVDHDTDIYYLYNHVSSGNSSVARKVLATLTCEVIVQQLTTHNKHQFHDSQSSSHHTIQTLQWNCGWVLRTEAAH